MILERVELTAREGQADALAAIFTEETLALVTAAPGCLGASVGRGVESPDKLILLVQWETLDRHKAFIGTPGHGEFGKRLAPHAAGGAMEHFVMG